MGSYGHLYVDTVHVASFRDGVPPTFMLLFRKDDLTRRTTRGSDRTELGYEHEEVVEVAEFSVGARGLRERLDVLGIGMDSVESAFREIVHQTTERPTHWTAAIPPPEELAAHWEDESRAVGALTVDLWIDEVRTRVAAGEPTDARGLEVGTLSWMLNLWDYVEPRLLLRIMCEAFPNSNFVLDVTDLVEAGWLEGDVDPRQEALDEFGWILANGSPVVVLTEGSTDAAILQTALEVLRPHLVDFLRFPDFTTGAEGGASALVRLIKSLWAAGIANRVVAVFDNDTASHEALRALERPRLPANLRCLTLPSIDLAVRYPTVGPGGPAEMDVNGLAGSIELYLGTDVLSNSDGTLMPVQWTGYSRALGRYQGELLDKRIVQERFRVKARMARDRRLIHSQDWSGMELVFDTIVDELRRGSHDPIDARANGPG